MAFFQSCGSAAPDPGSHLQPSSRREPCCLKWRHRPSPRFQACRLPRRSLSRRSSTSVAREPRPPRRSQRPRPCRRGNHLRLGNCCGCRANCFARGKVLKKKSEALELSTQLGTIEFGQSLKATVEAHAAKVRGALLRAAQLGGLPDEHGGRLLAVRQAVPGGEPELRSPEDGCAKHGEVFEGQERAKKEGQGKAVTCLCI